MAETVPGYEASAWSGMGAPKHAPVEVIAQLNKEITDIPDDPNMTKRLADLGGTPLRLSPAQFGTLIADETEKWRKVVEFSGAKDRVTSKARTQAGCFVRLAREEVLKSL